MLRQWRAGSWTWPVTRRQQFQITKLGSAVFQAGSVLASFGGEGVKGPESLGDMNDECDGIATSITPLA